MTIYLRVGHPLNACTSVVSQAADLFPDHCKHSAYLQKLSDQTAAPPPQERTVTFALSGSPVNHLLDHATVGANSSCRPYTVNVLASKALQLHTDSE